MQASQNPCNEPEKIIFGGAFDPPHQGHIDCLRLTHARFPQARILIIPSFKPAGSHGIHKSPVASFEDRLALCKKEFMGLTFAESLEILAIEKELPAPNYTIHTIEQIRAQFPNCRLGLIVGQDQLRDFYSWHKPNEILKNISLVAIQRRLEPSNELFLQKTAEDLIEALAIPATWNSANNCFVVAGFGTSIFLVEGQTSPAESRVIRTQLASHQTFEETWLPKSAHEYIKENGLYLTKENSHE